MGISYKCQYNIKKKFLQFLALSKALYQRAKNNTKYVTCYHAIKTFLYLWCLTQGIFFQEACLGAALMSFWCQVQPILFSHALNLMRYFNPSLVLIVL